MDYKSLKWLRIGVSAIFLILLTFAILDSAFAVTPLGKWIMSTQLVPAILAGSAIWIVLWVLVTISFGRIYCSSVCPLGTLQDGAANVGRRLSKGSARRYKYMLPVNGLRFPIPIFVVVCLFLGFLTVVQITDPFSVYGKIVLNIARPAAIGFGSIAGSIILLLIVCGLAAWRGRIICNTVCPIGGLLGLMSRNPVYRVDIDTDKCIHCGKCEDVCKSCCIDLRDCVVDNSRCVMCMNCTAICPNDAIKVRKGRFRLSTPMMEKTTV